MSSKLGKTTCYCHVCVLCYETGFLKIFICLDLRLLGSVFAHGLIAQCGVGSTVVLLEL